MHSDSDLEKCTRLFKQARLALQNYDVVEAEILLQQSVEIHPTFLPAYRLLEWVLDSQSRTDEAVLVHAHAQWIQLAVRLLEDS